MAESGVWLSRIDGSIFDTVTAMYRMFSIAAIALSITAQPAAAQTERGPYARIAVLRPHDGDTVDFEAGYLRHLEWHRQAGDKWIWYGWNVTFGERQRWFVYASFGHSAASLDNPVSPADDERDNILNVTPHAQFAGNGLYEFLPRLSRGSGVPRASARLELTTVDLHVGAESTFEAALAGNQSALRAETLWYRLIAGGASPRYVRLRPQPNLSAVINSGNDRGFPDGTTHLITHATVEILTLRPTMSLGIESPPRD